MIHTKIHLISAGCPQSSMDEENRGLKSAIRLPSNHPIIKPPPFLSLNLLLVVAHSPRMDANRDAPSPPASRVVIIAVDLSHAAEHAFECKYNPNYETGHALGDRNGLECIMYVYLHGDIMHSALSRASYDYHGG